MQWGSALSREPDTEAAARACVAKVRDALGGPAGTAFVFVSPHHRESCEQAAAAIREGLQAAHLLGCTAGGVIGDGHEAEEAPALSVTAARLPDVSLRPFHVRHDQLPDPDAPPRRWEEIVGLPPPEEPQFVVLADPFSIRIDALLAGLDYAYPNAVKVGGLASGARAPGGNVLMLDEAVHREGAVGLALAGDVRIDTLVAQGCRPIGKPLTVTECRRNILVRADGHPPIEVLTELFQASGERDRDLIRNSLFLGVIMDPFREGSPKAGDFLIRNFLGRDPETEGLAVNALLRQGLTVQFHVRDADAARQDLSAVLQRYAGEGAGGPAGALLFSCLGRGRHLYGRADHDTDLFRESVGGVPLGGFFCNGEIGPVGGTTHIHGFTSCFGLFRPRGENPKAEDRNPKESPIPNPES